LLNELIQQGQNDKDFSDKAIAYEVLFMLGASVSTMATQYVYEVLELQKNPDIKERVSQEINLHVAGGESVTLSQLDKLDYTNQFVQEVLRIYAKTVAPFGWGKTARPFTVHNHNIPKDWVIMGSLYSTNHSPVTYSDPHKFDPDRFKKDRAEGSGHCCAYVPMGRTDNVLENHGCDAYLLAPALMKLFLVQLLKGNKYHIELAAEQDLTVNTLAVPMVPKDGLIIQFTHDLRKSF